MLNYKTTYPVECANCCVTHRVERDEDGASLETWPCQGSDSCQVRMCGDCLTKCASCDLPACEAHLAPVRDELRGVDELWCTICLAGGDEFEAACRAAGCTPAETAALAKVIR